MEAGERDITNLQWPKAFTNFLQENKIDPNIYALEHTKRHFYVVDLNRGDLIKSEIPDCLPSEISPNLFSTLGNENISKKSCYRKGYIIGIDYASMMAINCLSLQSDHHVLDLCCAPGAKLSIISSLCRSVTGVDINKQRLFNAISMAKKYKCGNIRLFCADGRQFSVFPHHLNALGDASGSTYKDIYENDGCAPLHSSSAFRKQRGAISSNGYDRVLVDAQCTHDGSIKHVQKQIKNGWKYFDPDYYSENGLKRLYALQYDLISNGFKLLREGGILIYSTCSLSRHQNQEIVNQFLNDHKGLASVINIGCDGEEPFIRIDPSEESGGFFICKIEKLMSINKIPA